MSTVRISQLDGLRGVAIILVCFYHGYYRWNSIEPWAVNEYISELFQYGWIGVELFFLISGFVIYKTLENSQGFIEFLKNRIIRLFPAMIIASLFIFLTADFLPKRPLGIPNIIDFIPGLVFLDPIFINNISNWNVKSLDGSFWSLYIEVKFYILTATIYFFVGKKVFQITFGLYIFYLVSTVLSKYGYATDSLGFFANTLTSWGFYYYGWFLSGIAYYQYAFQAKNYMLIYYWVIGIFSAMLFSRNHEILVFVLLIFVLALFQNSFSRDFLRRILINRVLILFGFMSYPLYLIHQNFTTGLAVEIYTFLPHFNGMLYPFIGFMVSCCVAYAIAKIEVKLNRSKFIVSIKNKSYI